MLDQILKNEKHIGVIARVWGFFNFVNIMWILAIIGIVASVGPCIFICTRPLREKLAIFLKALAIHVRRILEWIWINIIFPVVIRLHNWGIFEIGFYYFSFLFLCQGYRLPSHEAGEFVALTGIIMAMFSYIYSTILWTPGGGDKELFFNVCQIIFGLMLVPTAIYYESNLLGWVVVLNLYYLLGFGVMCLSLC